MTGCRKAIFFDGVFPMTKVCRTAFALAGLVAGAGCEAVIRSPHQVTVNWRFPQSKMKTIGVMELEWSPPELALQEGISSGHVADAGKVVSDMLAAELLTLNRYDIRERSDLKRVLEEKKLHLADILRKGDYRLVGEIAGVDGVVIGRVNLANLYAKGFLVKAEVGFTCRCVSTKTGDLVWSIGGELAIDLTKRSPPHWLRVLTNELVRELGRKLNMPPANGPPVARPAPS